MYQTFSKLKSEKFVTDHLVCCPFLRRKDLQAGPVVIEINIWLNIPCCGLLTRYVQSTSYCVWRLFKNMYSLTIMWECFKYCIRYGIVWQNVYWPVLDHARPSVITHTFILLSLVFILIVPPTCIYFYSKGIYIKHWITLQQQNLKRF